MQTVTHRDDVECQYDFGIRGGPHADIVIVWAILTEPV
jgi:hypothetical protein